MKITTVDEYMAACPDNVQDRLRRLRTTILKNAPGATEKISWRMPAVMFNGALVMYAAFRNHIGLYPMPGVLKAFRKELKGFKQGKGSIRFPHDRPLPLALVKRIIRFRINENSEKEKGRSKGK